MKSLMIMQIVNIDIEISRNSDLCNFTFDKINTNPPTPGDKINDILIWHYIFAFKNQDLTRLNKNFTIKKRSHGHPTYKFNELQYILCRSIFSFISVSTRGYHFWCRKVFEGVQKHVFDLLRKRSFGA